MKRILIAGIGNIFMGDDAFGGEVVAELKQRGLPEQVTVIDFGIRSYDLAFALTDDYDTVVLVDAAPQGEPPGTTCLLELDLNELPKLDSDIPDGHSLNPVSVLQLAQTLGEVRAKLFLVGCEPAILEAENGELGLSEAVRAAVPRAAAMIEELVSDRVGAQGRSAGFTLPKQAPAFRLAELGTKEGGQLHAGLKGEHHESQRL